MASSRADGLSQHGVAAASPNSSSPGAALATLEAIEHAAQFVASDAAQLLGSLQGGLQSVRSALQATALPECSP